MNRSHRRRERLQGIVRNSLRSSLTYPVVVTIVLCGIYAIGRIAHSHAGRVLQTMRDDELRPRLCFDIKRYKLIAFVFSAIFIGLAQACSLS